MNINILNYILCIIFIYFRFINHKEIKERKIKEKQIEKIKKENQKEIEIINNCKTIKKPKNKVEEISNRMYEQAKIREAKNIKKLENYENEQKIINEKQFTFRPNINKSRLSARETNREKETKKDFNNDSIGIGIDILKKKKKNTVNYNFQVSNYYIEIFIFYFILFRLILILIQTKKVI
jgi:hypothetical protein